MDSEKPSSPIAGEESEDTKLSAAERRRQRKAEQVAQKKAEKAAKVQNQPAAASKALDNQRPVDDEELDPSKYYENRIKLLEAAKSSRGLELYPHKFHVTKSLTDFIQQYSHLQNGEQLEAESISVAGRMMRLAPASKGLIFYDLVSDGAKIQVVASHDHHADKEHAYEDIHAALKRGDIIGVTGFPSRTKRGELSIFATSTRLLSPCLHMLPKGGYQELKDQETRYRKRYLDLIVNPLSKKTFLIRSQIIGHIRSFLESDGFVEVETPMMHRIAGGANAKPFVTHHNELDADLFLRVAPELFLKMLIVGGINKVYEIGKNFRNEGIDLTHNPEFTSCEFYEAFADLYDLIDKTEKMLHSMVQKIHGASKVTLNIEDEKDGGKMKAMELDFTPPYRRISMVDEIEAQSGKTLPRPFDSPECIEVMKKLVHDNQMEMPHPPTAAKLLDKLCGHFIEERITNPTFIIEHPQVMSPLAKWHRTKPHLTERGELFMAGKEVCNFYTELNDPVRQRACFMDQAKGKEAGDDESMQIDEEFLNALEHGLPPTAGWGIGIDRLTMFLSNKPNIKEVILFPAMRHHALPPAAKHG